ncbi:MAG: DMT family transporter [Betaproteobacteria bacterium]
MAGAARTATLTALALLAFAGNSLLCRAALRDAAGGAAIDAASFTAIRFASGAAALWLLLRWRAATPQSAAPLPGSWGSAAALFIYAAAFSFAYLSLGAATGALLLFGAVQATMIGVALARGERLRPVQAAGALLAFGGLVALLLPGLTAPPAGGAALMLAAGAAWGAYSLRGRSADARSGNATAVTAGNFARAVPMALALALAALPWAHLDAPGVALAVASGALTSGVGYAIWYAALPALRATHAATVQLAVPVITALGGVLLLAEPLHLRLVLCAALVLGGIALVVLPRR